MDRRVNRRSHSDDRIQRDSVQLRKFRKQINGIEAGAKRRHDQCTHNGAENRLFSRFFEQVDHGRRQHQHAADREVCQLSDERGGRGL